MKFALSGCNTGPFAERDMALLLARLAEDAGIEMLLVFEHAVVPAGYTSPYPYSASGRMPSEGRGAIADPLAWIAFVAANTETVKLAPGVLILPLRSPVVLAKEVATIDRLSRGRLELGVGVGWLAEEFAAAGVPFEARGRRTDEYIRVLRMLWTEDEPSFAGEFVSFERARSFPKPFGAEGVPIVVGGHSQAAARRAGRLGDGFFPSGSPERVAELLPELRRAAHDAGRDPTSIDLTCGLGPQPVDADLVRRYEDLGASRLVLPVPAWDADTLRRRLDEMQAWTSKGR